MSSKPSTPIGARHYPGESESTRIPVLSSPTPFRRSCSMRLRPSLNETITKHHTNHYNHHHHQQQQKSTHQQQQHETQPSVLNNNKKYDDTRILQRERALSITRSSVQRTTNMDNNTRSLPRQRDLRKMSSFDTVDHHHYVVDSNSKSLNGSLRRNSFSKHNNNTNDRGMTLNLSNSHNYNNSGHANSPAEKSPQTPQTTGKSPKTPPVTPDGYLDDDLDSLNSYSSMASGMSSCDHPYFARNGTTFSGRKMKYVVHCSNYAGQTGSEYLTPTQRAQRHIRRLKELLIQAKQDLEQKDSEILRLTKEVVELRLFKASLSSPDERSNSSDCTVPTVRENTTNDLHTPASEIASPLIDMVDDAFKTSPRHVAHLNRTPNHLIHQVQLMDRICNSEMQSSFADSGHFEDITTSSVHSKDSYVPTQDRCVGSDEDIFTDSERQLLVQMYEEKIEELIKQHDAELTDEKRSHNDRIEALLHKLAESNSRFCDLVPDYEQAKERIRELERQLELLQKQLEEQEDKSNKMYLHMYTKGQEAERIQQREKVLEIAQGGLPSRVSIPELMHQLQVTQDELENIRDENYEQASGSQALLSAKEAISLWLLGARKTMYKRLADAQQTKNKIDPEVTLQFLKSAIYYFLTDKENSQGHLNAIESILGFSDKERSNIDKARASK